MPAPRRVRLQIDERRAQLIELGTRLFSSRSYEDISIDDVAEQAGISKGLLYHYFGGKREYYVEVLRAASQELRRLTAPDPRLSPAARLRAAVDAHLNYVQTHGAVYAAIYRSGSIAPEVRKILEEHREVVMRYFLEDFGIGKPRPMLRAALRSWIAMVEGACLDWIARPELDRDSLRELLIAGYGALLTKVTELDPKTATVLKRLVNRAGKPRGPQAPVAGPGGKRHKAPAG
jgi:AcrR family transcriptional regulator